MFKKSAVYGEYLIIQQQSGTVKVLREFDNTIDTLRKIAKQVGFDYDDKWNTRHLGSQLIDALTHKATEKTIVRADVVGKSQNRTALGMMNAYLKMHPNTTLAELRATFPKQEVCPNAGISDIFYTPSEIEQAITQEQLDGKSRWFADGYALLNKKDEDWLLFDNGQKAALNQMWSASSLALLQKQMATFGIYGEVGSVPEGAPAGFTVTYNYADVEAE